MYAGLFESQAFPLTPDPRIGFSGSGSLSVDEDTPSISLPLTSSTTGADGLVELYTTDGTATGENYINVAPDVSCAGIWSQ